MDTLKELEVVFHSLELQLFLLVLVILAVHIQMFAYTQLREMVVI
jgi:hypothetical protein